MMNLWERLPAAIEKNLSATLFEEVDVEVAYANKGIRMPSL